MTKAISWASTLLIAALASSTLLADPTEYRLELLPVPPDCESNSVLHGLDQSGTAVGLMTCPSAEPRAVAWVDSSLMELDTLGGPSATPYGIGPRGLVVGTAELPEMYDSVYHVTRPVVWENGVARELGTLGGPIGAAVAMAPSGTVVGVCQPEAEDPMLHRRPERACVWEGAIVRDLGDLGGPEAAALDVSARGWVAGFSMTAKPYPTGACCEEHAFMFDGTEMHDLGTLGGPISFAYSLNDRGDVVGLSYPVRTPVSGMPSWHAFVWRDGVMRNLETLGGAFSEALDINDRGNIVGWSFTLKAVENWTRRAVLWQDDQAIDLNDLVPDRAGCVLLAATSINNAGDILANAWCDYKRRVVLLTPVRDHM